MEDVNGECGSTFMQLEMSENDQYVEQNFTEYLWSPLISKLAFLTDAVIRDPENQLHWLIFYVLYTRKCTKGY